MKYYDVEQNTEEWYRLRLGIPTASEFDKIITPTGKMSSQANGYANKLLAEIMLNDYLPMVNTPYMERGKILEQEAADEYQLVTGTQIKKGGFCTTDDGKFGCSPDRFVSDEGLLEIKCPAANTHIEYMLEECIDTAYYPQLMGQLYVTGRQWVDVYSYCPGLISACIRVERDPIYMPKLEKALSDFRDLMSRKIEKLQDKKIFRVNGIDFNPLDAG
jgi:hypothetical protein